MKEVFGHPLVIAVILVVKIAIIFLIINHFITADDLRELEDWAEQHQQVEHVDAGHTHLLGATEAQNQCKVDCSTVAGGILHALGCDCE